MTHTNSLGHTAAEVDSFVDQFKDIAIDNGHREILSVLYIERDKRKKDDRITPKRLTPEQKEKLIRENEQMLNNVKEALEYLKAIVEKIEDNQTKINTDRIRHDDY